MNPIQNPSISSLSLKNFKTSKINVSKEEYQNSPFVHVDRIISFLRIDFMNTSGWSFKFNVFINSIFVSAALYYLGFMAKTMFYNSSFYILDMSLQLLSMIWNFEAILSMIFIIRWQQSGQLSALKQMLEKFQSFKGVREKAHKFQSSGNVFLLLYFLVTCFNFTYYLKYYFESSHSVWAISIASMFYYEELRCISMVITTYMHGIWLTTIYVYVTFTNVTYFEIKHFNNELRLIDGNSPSIKSVLVRKIEIFRKLSEAIFELDNVFQLYTFAMLTTVIPILIFTIMMLNQHLTGSIVDVMVCLPFIMFCICSFCSITIAPARVHDEIQNMRSALFSNQSLWQIYNPEIYQLASTLASRCDQKGLGISIWGFAVLSRPLILATLSATAMMMSLLSDYTPPRDVES